MDDPTTEFQPLSSEQRRTLALRYGLEPSELDKLLEDLWLLTEESYEEYARRRHAELRDQAMRNERAFEIIRREIAAGRFAQPELSLRQVRRIIYG